MANEKITPVENKTEAEKKAETEKRERENQARAIADAYSKGTLQLIQPIMSNGHEVTELKFDFMALSGWETVEAMSSEEKYNAFRLSYRQGLSLFAAAAAKATEDVDKEDIIANIGMQDTMKAVQIATVFFNASSRVTGGATRNS